MRIVTAEQMKSIDRYAIDVLEIPSIVLMENAALQTIQSIDLERRHSFAVFCGVGNNGGDGLAIARGLITRGKKVIVFCIGDREKSSEDFETNYRALQHLTEIFWISTLGDLELMNEKLENVNTIIDCIFGTGLSREIRSTAAIVIDNINQSRIYTISVDMPSGLNATTGEVHGAFIEASEIICLQCMKKGLVSNSYAQVPTKVVQIGIPEVAIRAILGDE